MSTTPGLANRSNSDAAKTAPATVLRRLEQVVRRIRTLYLVAGCARVLSLALAMLVALYLADRFLQLPVVVRGLLVSLAVVVLALQVWRRILRPLVVGVSRLEAARLVEEKLPSFDGRLVSALQLGDGVSGSFERQISEEASRACEEQDLRHVLTAKPALLELLRAVGGLAIVISLVVLARPYLDVFFARLALGDMPWPRDTVLDLALPERSPVHVLLPDGSVVASRGGVLNVSSDWKGVRPDRVELMVEGEKGARYGSMALGSSNQFHGHLTVEMGDSTIGVRGGDDDGSENRTALLVIEPPRLDEPEFVLEYPDYLGMESETVEAEGLSVPEGTRITLSGRPVGEASAAELQLLSRAEPIELDVIDDQGGQKIEGSFEALESDTLSVLLSGEYGLATPDPSYHALVVREDRAPALRIYAPPRSDIKVTANSIVPFAVVAEDDHGVDSVFLDPDAGSPRPFEVDPISSKQYRFLLDVKELGLTGTFSYALEAMDGRQLVGKGPQVARVEGRRIDVVNESEVQRLLADRQLRLKESLHALRERQQRASESTSDLIAEEPEDLDGELVAAAVAQNQVTTRLARETRELCAILEETITNRLDPGPGAEGVLERYLQDWRGRPVDEAFAAAPWRELAADYSAGRYGRLDLVGRLLEMTGMALELSEDLSPDAHAALTAARQSPGLSAFQNAQAAQIRVEEMLDRLLDRMDEWEDYQEVLSLVKTLIQDQQSLRARTETALKTLGGN